MRFDWLAFCKQRRIPFEREGKSTAKGNISIHCPFCGAADRAHHMGLSLNVREPFWGCWRNAKHRGRDPARLVAKLLGIAYGTAEALVELSGTQLDEFENAVERLRSGDEESRGKQRAADPLDLPREFRLLSPQEPGPYADMFISYLGRRGFGADARAVARRYELYFALSGAQAWRLIFPVRDERGVLVGWTGREIREGARIKYLTSANLPPRAILRFNQDKGAAQRSLLVSEGPFDALKLDFYGEPLGFAALATMGTGASLQKVSDLRALRRRGRDLILVFDSDATSQALSLAEEIGARWAPLPEGIKDPGEMTAGQVRAFLQGLRRKSG